MNEISKIHEINEIECDRDEYIAVLYDTACSETVPTGMMGPSRSLYEVAAKALQWVHDGVGLEANRRADIAYMTGDIPPKMEIDITIRGHGASGGE